jgi:oxygen-dependent protoporphyrinogen oxidase
MKIAVLGGGISGLSTAYFLKKEFPNASIQVIEASNWGGWIRSIKRKHTLFETGPRTLRPHGEPGAFTLDLVQELGLDNNLLQVKKTSSAAKNRFVYAQSELQKLPSSLLGMLLQKPRIFKGIPKELAMEFFNQKHRKIYENDESIQSFFSRRFGE